MFQVTGNFSDCNDQINVTRHVNCEFWGQRDKESQTTWSNVLQATNGLLQEWRKTTMPKKTWVQQTSILNVSWAALQGSLLNMVVSEQAVDKLSSMKCSKNLPVVCCWNCDRQARLCGYCDQLVQNLQPCHGHDAIKSGFLRPVPTIGLWWNVGSCGCAIWTNYGIHCMCHSLYTGHYCL